MLSVNYLYMYTKDTFYVYSSNLLMSLSTELEIMRPLRSLYGISYCHQMMLNQIRQQFFDSRTGFSGSPPEQAAHEGGQYIYIYRH